MTTTDYFVEMKLTPVPTVPTPAEGIAFTERFVLPTLEVFEQLVASGRIVAGGPALGAMSFAFIARVESPQQLEDTLASLPLWPRAQTTLVPLGSFHTRAAAIRERLATQKAKLATATPLPVAVHH